MFLIKELSLQTKHDYFHFFEKVLFAHDKHMACYCTAWNMSLETYVKKVEEPVKNGELSLREAGRRAAEELISEGKLGGYIAYSSGEPIGWCNANDITAYVRLGGNQVEQNEQFGITKSIVCFEIASSYKNRGVASELLRHICTEASEQGYQYIEAYPNVRNVCSPEYYCYLRRMYEKAGFEVLQEYKDGCVVRKSLRS